MKSSGSVRQETRAGTNGTIIAVVVFALAFMPTYAAVWQSADEAVKNFLDTANWDVSDPPTNGEAMVFGPLAAAPTYGTVGQTVLVEARQSNGAAFKSGLKWTFGPITDAEETPSRRSWKLASTDKTNNTGLRTFDVTMSSPFGYAGWWRLLYGGVTVSLPDSGGDTALATVSTEGFSTVNVPGAGSTARIGDYASGGTLAKTGAGTLEIGIVSGTDAIIHVKEGAVAFKGRAEEVPTYAPGAIVHLDASQTNTMVLSVGDDGRQYVERWGSVDGIGGYATNILYNAAPWGIPASHAPFISPTKANGLSIVDFGAATPAKSALLGPTNCMLTVNAGAAKLNEVREAFYAGYYTEDNGNTLILGSGSAYYYSRTSSTPLASWGGSCVLTGDIMLNGRKVAWDHPMTAAIGDNYTAMHTFSVGGWGTSHIAYLGSDRTYKNYTGGCRLGEVIIYTNELTRAERVATHRYLMRKWLPREKWADYDLDALTVASANTPVSVSSQGGDGKGVLRVANVSAYGGTLVKTGDGTLEMGRVSPAGVTVSVQGGAVAFAPPPAAPDSPADAPYMWLDATQTSSLTFTNESGSVDYVGRWADRRAEYAATRYAAPQGAGLQDVPPNAPYMVYGAQNGLNAISFGKTNALKGGDSSWFKMPSGTIVYEGFMVVKVYSTTTYGVNLFDNYNNLDFLRSSTTALLSSTYANLRGRLARWSVDGAVTDPVRDGSFRNDGVYHVVHFSSTEQLGITSLAKDRLGLGSQWGMMEMGEILLYDRRLDPAERDRTERYLMRRWIEPERCKDINGLTVSGKLALGDGGQASPAALTGDLTIANGSTVVSKVLADGSCGSLALSGTLTFAGSVRLQYGAGDASRPAAGRYTLFTADSIEGFDASAWTLESSAERPRPASVSCDGHSVTLTIGESGSRILLW
ncbi:MAG: hypothetical protein IKE55_03355 [Kiritimatiellae bacterium]|nr:hypothetical protein [Kiritimatiellia bacterium]